MKLEIVHVRDCPNVAVLEDRIRQALGATSVVLTYRVIDDPAQAAAAGMTGSPTLLIEGHDPFATAGQVPSLSCRLYPCEAGGVDGAPSVAALRAALGSASTDSSAGQVPVACCTPSAQDRAPAEEVRSWRSTRPVDPAEQALHHAILRAFATHGHPPTLDELAEVAGGYDVSAEDLLQQLHEADVIRLDAAGTIASAYPFSAAPTPHRVRIAGGTTVYAMCAIDALGMAAMLDTDVTIDSGDPVTGEPITVALADQRLHAQPGTAVVFVGGRALAGPSADTCCRYLNFFTDRAGADSWAADHPQISGVVLDLDEAHTLGIGIFANLLRA
ncbi:alkylmercury lyase family protein [Nocardia brasiliensis]|uniref:alkylmercury lyase family protein n=1 Tax=Nocardia brasiliensis TaxID=37326 RepID=UPI0037B97578